MRLDTNVAFGAICHSLELLKAEILDISCFAIPHRRDHGFLNSLHFLAPYQPGKATPEAEKQHSSCRNHCPCKTAPKFSHSSPQTLRFAKIHECRHYLAVSYCWHRGEAAREDPADKFRIRTAKGEERLARAPTSIIRRAIEYAIQYKIPYIWIDQDCIEQSDRDVRIAGIQSLDLVYRRAENSVGLLREPLSSQRHINALLGIREIQQALTTSDTRLPNMDWEAINELLQHLAGDEWFTRSWILQEYTLAKDMRLIVECGPYLNIPPILQIGHDQVELLPKDFDLADIGHQYFSRGKLGQLSFDRLLQAIRSINARPVCQPLGTFGGEERCGTNASKSLWYLRKRKNTRVRDRITILSNLCDYEIRLDTRQKDLESHSFSVTLLTLALLNGDFSLLFTEPDEAVVPKLSDSWLPVSSSTFEQVKGLGDLGDTIRFATSGISDRGLGCKGYIIQVNTQIDMAKIQKLYAKDYQNHGISVNQMDSNIQQELNIGILLDVALVFEEQGYHVLATLIKSWVRSVESLDPEFTANVAHRTPDEFLKAKRLDWLIDVVMSQGSLWCGTFGENLSAGKPTAIFDCSRPNLVFLPYSESFKSLPQSTLLDLPVAWEVDTARPAIPIDNDAEIWLQTEEDTLIKCVRKACGIFQVASSKPKSYTLAWASYSF
jgi:hypothetical protein